MLRRVFSLGSVALLAVTACGKSSLLADLSSSTHPDLSCDGATALGSFEPVSAAVANHRLWLVGGDGRLVSFDPASSTYREYPELAPIYRVVAGGDHAVYPLDLVGDAVRVHRIDARGQEGRGFPLMLPSTTPLATAAMPNGVAVIAADHVELVAADGRVTTRALPGSAPASSTSVERLRAASTTSGTLFIGSWSGGLRRLRPNADVVTTIDGIEATDRVSDVVRDPVRADCVAVAFTKLDGASFVARACDDGQTATTLFPLAPLPGKTRPIKELVVRGPSLVAVTSQPEQELVPVSPRLAPRPLPSTSDHCGVSLVALDEAWLIPNRRYVSADDPHSDLVVLKPVDP